MTNKQILLIGGVTASGKTKLATELAKKFDGELISADSRQIFIGMNIGTGKDIPKEAIFQLFKEVEYGGNNYRIGYYLIDGVRLWLCDCANIYQDFNVAAYDFLARIVIEKVLAENKLPIIVGGTGLYMRTLLDPPETLHIPINPELRDKYSDLSVDQLQMQLIIRNKERFDHMNCSDQHNPRRLIRAIEVTEYDNRKHSNIQTFKRSKDRINIGKLFENYLFIGLSLNKEKLNENITKRVQERIEAGVIDEVKYLKLNELKNDLPAKSTLGYEQIQLYLEGSLSLSEATTEWIQKETAYAKRQLTFFKRQPDINWFEAMDDTQSQIVTLVKRWYYRNND